MEYVKLKDLTLSTQYGYTAEETSKTEGIYKYLRITDIVPYFVDIATVPYCTIPQNKVDQYLVHEGDVLIARTGATTGYNYVVPKDVRNTVYASYLIRFNLDKSKILPSYLKYVLKSQSYYGFVNNYIGGSAQPGMNARVFGRFSVPYNSLPVQTRIASILSAYDNLIENNNHRIRLLEQMAENLYKEWFVRFRFPGHEKAEFENGIPKSWEKVTLEAILSKITTGLNPRKNFVLGEGNNYYVTIKNMGDNNIYLDENCDKVNDDAIKKINRRSDLRTGDILFSGIGTIGRVYLVTIPTNNWNVSESVFTMRANKKVSKEFLYLLLLSDKLQFYCRQHAQGVAQPGIRMSELKAFRFNLPPIDIIDKFTKNVSGLLTSIDTIRKSNALLSRQRDLLLPRLMSGKLEVKC